MQVDFGLFETCAEEHLVREKLLFDGTPNL